MNCRMRRPLAIFLLAVLGACAAPARAPAEERATIERVVDGDTVIVRVEGRRERVRLIGIDTPEVVRPGVPVECYGPESSAYAKSLLPAGTGVVLRYDAETADRFGRTLAHLFRADGLFVALDLVERGYARALTIGRSTSRARDLEAAERRARAQGLGLWGACPPRG